MNRAIIDGVELEYEVRGSGEPVLLITGAHLAGAFLPLLSEPPLSERHRLIRYHKRGLAGSTHTPPPVGIADHAADAAELLEVLGVDRAHVIGHSSGGAVALQLALGRPDLVHTLSLLEPALLSVPAAEAFFEKAKPAVEAYAAGDPGTAVVLFLSTVGGLDPDGCIGMLEARIPGGVAQAIRDADTFFRAELPALLEWPFGEGEARRISRPALLVIGTRTEPLFWEAAEVLGSGMPRLERCVIDAVGHLLHMEDPASVARGIAEFLARHPMSQRGPVRETDAAAVGSVQEP